MKQFRAFQKQTLGPHHFCELVQESEGSPRSPFHGASKKSMQ